MKSIKFGFSLILVLLIICSAGFVSAHDNSTDTYFETQTTDVNILDADNSFVDESDANISNSKITTKIVANSPSVSYNEKCELIGYLKDENNATISNKEITIFLDGRNYTKISDSEGKFLLNVKLFANSYDVKINFGGDEKYSSCQYDTLINVKAIPVSLKSSNYNTYWGSDLFFKVNVFNNNNNDPLKGIRVLFKVFKGNNLYRQYYAYSDENGVAYLSHNFDVGSYDIQTSIINLCPQIYSLGISNSKATLNILPTAEMGCCSFLAQLTPDEFISGFRRDSTYAADIYVKIVDWYGRLAIKQYKETGTHFTHMVVTSDGWAIGIGGADNARINSAIEDIAGKMVKSNSMPTSSVKSIMNYIKSLGIGHFVIKSPEGKYVAVWKDGYRYGQLNVGQYISVPNSQSYFRQGSTYSFGSHPQQVGIKIGASDRFGVNRRDIIIYDWRAVTDMGSTTTHVNVFAANDNGKWVGRSTAYLKDNIYYKDKFFSKDSLPQTVDSRYIGTHAFGKINYLKCQLNIDAPVFKTTKKNPQIYKVRLTYKSNNKPIKNLDVKVMLYTGNNYKVYTLRTDANGYIYIKTDFMTLGYHKIYMYPGNRFYHFCRSTSVTIT